VSSRTDGEIAGTAYSEEPQTSKTQKYEFRVSFRWGRLTQHDTDGVLLFLDAGIAPGVRRSPPQNDTPLLTSVSAEGHGSAGEVAREGELLARRARLASSGAPAAGRAGRLAAHERRISLPLADWEAARVTREARKFVERFGAFPGAARFAREWERRALEARQRLAGQPRLENVPVQAMRVGPLRILALPGEPFTRLGARIRDRFPSTWVIGYANGSVGYLPTREAFADPADCLLRRALLSRAVPVHRGCRRPARCGRPRSACLALTGCRAHGGGS
jgi:hypothetical protein